MENVVEKLKLLDYERKFCRARYITRAPLKMARRRLSFLAWRFHPTYRRRQAGPHHANDRLASGIDGGTLTAIPLRPTCLGREQDKRTGRVATTCLEVPTAVVLLCFFSSG
jgi:hypothetical protein